MFAPQDRVSLLIHLHMTSTESISSGASFSLWLRPILYVSKTTTRHTNTGGGVAPLLQVIHLLQQAMI